MMRARSQRVAIGAALLFGAVGCELIAGLEDHSLVGATSIDGSTDGNGEAQSGPGFSITAAPSLTLQQGASAPVNITIARTGGFADTVNVTVSGLPAGTTTSPLTITSDATTGSVTIAVAASTPQSLSHLSINGVSGDGKTSASEKMDLIVSGPPGSLDLLFGNQGIATGFTSGVNVNPSAIALDASGNILILGTQAPPTPGAISAFTMFRVTPAGALDKTFGQNGILTTAFNGQSGVFSGLFPLATGEIQVAGYTNPQFGARAVVFTRVTTSGVFDTAYSLDGGTGNLFDNTDAGMNEFTMNAANLIYATGGSGLTSPYKLHIERRLASGLPDSTFTAGDYAFGTAGDDTIGEGVTVQSDGKVVTLLNVTDSAGQGMGLARFTDTGAVDNTFGTNGYVAPSADTLVIFENAVKMQPDGKILALGTTFNNGTIARYAANGSFDTFGESSGTTTLSGELTDFALQSDGKIVIVGDANVTEESGTNTAYSVQRLAAGGLPDTTFGNKGAVVNDLSPAGATLERVLVQPDGRIVAVGLVYTSQGTSDFAIARYWP
jgi:uncharacterized delta-60 repeat protein